MLVRSHAKPDRHDPARSAADRTAAKRSPAREPALLDRRPATAGLSQLARIANPSGSRGIVQRYVVRHRFDGEENKLTEQDVRDDPRWSRLNSRQQAELLRRVHSSRKEVLDDAFTASAILFRDDAPAQAETAPCA